MKNKKIITIISILTSVFFIVGVSYAYFKTKIVSHDAPVLIAATGIDDSRFFWGYKENIKSITFEKGIDIPLEATASWDVSVAQDGGIMAYVIGSTTYDLYVQTENDYILSNPNSSWLFGSFTNLTSINNLSMLNTYLVTNMYWMFSACSNLTSLDLSTFDTSNVTSMSCMFMGCEALTSLDLSSFDTSNVTDMFSMFLNCQNLTSLNLSSFNTSKVIKMSNMFFRCTALTTLNLHLADFSKVTDYGGMFIFTTSGITITVKDSTAQKWITARLTEAGKTGNVIIV